MPTDRTGSSLLRLCAAPHDRGGTSVRFSADADGRLRILAAMIDASPRSGTIDAVVEAAANAFGLTSDARTRFVADAALAEWNKEFAAILDELGGSAAPVAGWLHANPRAGGADVFLGQVELSYRVDLDAYVKEIFGGVRTARL